MKKIILIDDNKSNQREIYGATFVDNEEYEDCLVHKEHLNENGWILFEIGCDQGAAVSEMLDYAGFKEIRVIKDLARNDRVVIGRM